MSEIKAFRTAIIVSVLLIFPASVMAGDKPQAPDDQPRTATLWIVIFNDPSACLYSPCTDAEFGREGNPSGLDVCYVTGQRVPTAGWATFGGHFAVGSNFGCIWSGLGLQNAAAFEAHFVVQRHGRLRVDLLTDQVTEFLGGCMVAMGCLDVHFAIHVASGELDQTASFIYRFANGSRIWGASSVLRRYEDGVKVALNTYFDPGSDWWGMAGGD